MTDGPANFRTTAEEPTLPPAPASAEPPVIIEEILIVEVPARPRKKAAKKSSKKVAKKAAKKTSKKAAKKATKKVAKKAAKKASKKAAKKSSTKK
jgi:hypothetical protein